SAFQSPIAGRQAWTGNSGGYITTTVNLGQNVIGQTIKLRFRMGSDNSAAAKGWLVDTITIRGVCPSPSPSPTPTPAATATPCGAVLSQNFDGVVAPALPAGWTSAATGAEVAWVTSTVNPASAPNDAFAPDPTNVGNTELFTPIIAAPAGGGILT